MRWNMVLKSLSLLFVLLIAVAALAAPAANNQSAASSGNAFRTYLQPDLTFKSRLSPEFLPQTQTQGTQIGSLRTCGCSCGLPCVTDADCGPGGVCRTGITCCNRGPQDPQNAWLQALSSNRAGEAQPVSMKCK
jgi:hypothetical protein